MTSQLHRSDRPPKPELTDELLSAYIDGQLSAQERARVDAVLDRSAVDRDNLEMMQQTVNLLHELPRVPLPRAFTLSEAQVGIRRQERRTWGFFALLRSATVATAMLFAVLLGGDYYLRTVGVPGTTAQPMVALQTGSAEMTAAEPTPAAAGSTETMDNATTQESAEPTVSSDNATQNGGEETPSAQRSFAQLTSPTEEQSPSTKQAPAPAPQGLMVAPSTQDGGGGEGMGGGAGGPGMGGGGEPAPGGEFSMTEPIPSIVPLDETEVPPAAAAQEATEPTPTPLPSPTPEPTPTLAPQVAMAAEDADQGQASESQPMLPEAQGSTLSQLRQLRDRWQQPIVIVEIALGALVVSLLAATWVVGRRNG